MAQVFGGAPVIMMSSPFDRGAWLGNKAGKHKETPMIFTVAIDGPAAAGKGTVGRAVARRFGFSYLDTGLLYRAIGAAGGDPVAAAQALRPEDCTGPGLRSREAGLAASRVAAIPQVRAALTAFQRQFARREGGAVLDGRDIGTVVCPEAEAKLYVTASPQVRAHRRWLELGGDEAQVLAEVLERDARDTDRATSPLRPAADAVLIDTSEMSIEDAVGRAIALVKRKLAAQEDQR
jgi:cytidylate kinase